jgi:hypothetical protein
MAPGRESDRAGVPMSGPKKSPLRERAEVYFLGGDRGDRSIMLHRSRLIQLNFIMTVIGLMHNALYTVELCCLVAMRRPLHGGIVVLSAS